MPTCVWRSTDWSSCFLHERSGCRRLWIVLDLWSTHCWVAASVRCHAWPVRGWNFFAASSMINCLRSVKSLSTFCGSNEVAWIYAQHGRATGSTYSCRNDIRVVWRNSKCRWTSRSCSIVEGWTLASCPCGSLRNAWLSTCESHWWHWVRFYWILRVNHLGRSLPILLTRFIHVFFGIQRVFSAVPLCFENSSTDWLSCSLRAWLDL